MNIAISQRIIVNKNGDRVDALEHSYLKYFQNFGVTLIPVPNVLKNIPSYFKNLKIERIILSGGGDINPKLYGGKLSDKDNYSPERDRTEKEILKFAKLNKIPVLGICRGTQFLNVFFDGSLIQDLKATFPNSQNHIATVHQIKLLDLSFKKSLAKKKFYVNSYHNSGLNEKTLSSKLKVFAETEDSLIEGIYHPKLPIAGIMWHPERESPDKSLNNKLIQAFLKRRLYWSELSSTRKF